MQILKSFSATAGLVTAWAFSMWVNSYQEFSHSDTISFALHFTSVMLLLFAVYAVFFAAVQRKWLPPFLLRALNALICVIGLHTLVLIHIEFVAGLAPVLMALLLATLLGVFILLFNAIEESAKVTKFAYVLIGIFFVQNILAYAWGEFDRRQTLANASVPAHFSFPKFKSYPNVYMIGFDALVPTSIGKEILKIDNLPYVDYLTGAGFRPLRNTFAERVPTGSFYNSLIAMDKKLFDDTPRPERFMFDTAEMPAPLYELFRHNGYKVQFMYKSSYFGLKERAKVDFYGYSVARGICTHIDEKYALMGFCLDSFINLRNRFNEPGEEYPQFLFKRIKEVAKSGDHWLTVAHIWFPGHTGLAHSVFEPEDLKSYRAEYARRSKTVVEQMRTLVETIRKHDPDAIIFIFGDHGTFSSRGLKEGGVPEGSPMTEKQVFQDRRANAVFIYPKGFCADEFREPFGHMRLGRAIVKCLSGQDPLPADYQANDNEYLPYLYE